jgi:hypothetical protein
MKEGALNYPLTVNGSKSHKNGSQCAECTWEFKRKQSAETQLYELLNMQWVGTRTAVTFADLARHGIEEACPEQAQDALGSLKENNTDRKSVV